MADRRYVRSGHHRSQFDGSTYAGENCTPTSGANGAREATAGKYDHTGGNVRGLVKRTEETNPATPGWSLTDLDLAMSRAGVPFVKGTGGWDALRLHRAKGRGIVLQGDSDQFLNDTCSGHFDGDHAVYIHPDTRMVDGVEEWLLGDPICPNYRWEKASRRHADASKFNTGILYGVFTTALKPLDAPAPQPPTGEVMPLPITSTAAATVDVPAGTVATDLDGTTPLRTMTGDHIGMFSPMAYGTKRAIYIPMAPTGARLALVPAKNVKPVTDSSPYTQAQLDAAAAKGLSDGIAKEKSRLRSLLGL